MLRSIVLILLPLLSVAGAFGTYVLGFRIGTFEIINGVLAQKNALFPGSDTTLVRNFTGIEVIDHQLQILVVFFAPVVGSGSNDLMLFCMVGAGQFAAAWALLVMESLRVGNKGKLVSFIGTLGFLIQNVAFTVAVPLYLALHLLTSPVAKQSSQALLIPTTHLKIIPVSVILGYVLPTVLMVLPSPGTVSPEAHQQLIAFWQLFPVWSVITHWSIKYLVSKTSGGDVLTDSSVSHGTKYVNASKPVYKFILGICMITQLPVLAFTLLPPSTLSRLSPSLSSIPHSTFADVFVPYLPGLNFEVANLSAGILTFLQWDLYIGSTALLLWAMVLCRTSKSSPTIYGDANVGWGRIAWKTLVWTLMSGPAGAVSALLLERDAVVGQKIKGGL